MVLDPIPQSLPVLFFGSRPQPPTSRRHLIAFLAKAMSSSDCLRNSVRKGQRRGVGLIKWYSTPSPNLPVFWVSTPAPHLSPWPHCLRNSVREGQCLYLIAIISAHVVQRVPWKMRLDRLIGMQIKILTESRNYRFMALFKYSIEKRPRTIVLWLRSGFRFPFRWPFRVSSSAQRAVLLWHLAMRNSDDRAVCLSHWNSVCKIAIELAFLAGGMPRERCVYVCACITPSISGIKLRGAPTLSRKWSE